MSKTTRAIAAAAAAVGLASAWCAPARADDLTYTLTGNATGEYTQGASPTLHSFFDVFVELDFNPVFPGTDFPGQGEIYSLDNATLSSGATTLTFDADPNRIIGFGEGTMNNGSMGFGDDVAGNITIPNGWGGAGLDGYTGGGPLAPTPVQFFGFHELFVHDAGGTEYGLYIDQLTNAEFSASVPEPAAWGLMIAGFGLAGASLRARRRAAVG